MKKYILILSLLMIGCGLEIDQENTLQATSNLSVEDVSDNNSLPKKPCKPDVFTNGIPAGYTLNPECPPEIIWPAKIILPNDPSPVIH